MTIRDLHSREAMCGSFLGDAEALSPWATSPAGDSSGRFCLVAEEPPGKIAGLVVGQIIATTVAQIIAPTVEGEILDLFVRPEVRRRGIATALLEQALERMRLAGVGRVWLEVRASNAPALALYRRLNFVERGRRPGYYRNPQEDALRLESVLPPVLVSDQRIFP